MGREPTHTEAAIDDVIASAAAVVSDTLEADGIPPPRIRAKDVPHPVHRCAPARPPSPTVPEQPTERVPVVSLAMLARQAAQLDVQTPSLSAFEVPGRQVFARPGVHDAPTRRAADPYPRWVLGATALVAIVASAAAVTMRLQQDESAAPPAAAPLPAATELPAIDAGTVPLRRRRMVGEPDR